LYTYIENFYTHDAPVEEFSRIAGEEISLKAEDDMMTMAEGKLEVAQTHA